MLQQSATSSPSTPSGRRDGESIPQSSELYEHNGSGEMNGAGLTLELDPSRACRFQRKKNGTWSYHDGYMTMSSSETNHAPR